MSPESTGHASSVNRPSWFQEAQTVWRQLPDRWVLLGLIAAWIGVFHFLGNSTLGYTPTPSLFGWWYWVFTRMGDRPDGSFDVGAVFSADEAYAWFIPLVVLWLLWSRRAELVALPKQASWWCLG